MTSYPGQALEDASTVTVSTIARERLKELVCQPAGPALLLRVYTVPGGCSGFSYGMELTAQAEEGDVIDFHDGVGIVVDPVSAQNLRGSEIDFVEGLMRSGFTVHNPNATRACACGQSFRTAESSGTACACSH